MEAKSKICKTCNTSKTINCFPKNGKYYKNQCKICKNSYSKIWNKNNRSKRRKYEYVWRLKNKEHYLKTKNKNENKRYHERKNTDVLFYLKISLRRRFAQAIRNNYKTGSAVQDLGCSIEDFKAYIESKFQEGMTWDNKGSWHIDHIRPLVSFDLTNKEQVKQACHYTNLQPLWAKDNLKKGCHYVQS